MQGISHGGTLFHFSCTHSHASIKKGVRKPGLYEYLRKWRREQGPCFATSITDVCYTGCYINVSSTNVLATSQKHRFYEHNCCMQISLLGIFYFFVIVIPESISMVELGLLFIYTCYFIPFRLAIYFLM